VRPVATRTAAGSNESELSFGGRAQYSGHKQHADGTADMLAARHRLVKSSALIHFELLQVPPDCDSRGKPD
jgi:hypothetical protein